MIHLFTTTRCFCVNKFSTGAQLFLKGRVTRFIARRSSWPFHLQKCMRNKGSNWNNKTDLQSIHTDCKWRSRVCAEQSKTALMDVKGNRFPIIKLFFCAGCQFRKEKSDNIYSRFFFPTSEQGILHGSNHNLSLEQLCPQYQFIDFQGGRFIFFPGLSLVNRRLWYYLKVCHDTLRFHLPLLFVSWVLFGFVFTVFLKSVARLVVPVTEVFAYLSPCISFTNSQMDLCVSPVY